MLYGRGAADMKSSLAAMISAIESLLNKDPNPIGTLSFLITSDEEGDAIHGTRHAISELASRGIRPD
jgi:succinyl-diaminopimelate desuccinylase